MNIKVFIDSDVIISSLISTTGAAHLLMHTEGILLRFITNISLKELEIVTERLRLDNTALTKIFTSRCIITTLEASAEKIKKTYRAYVADEHDAHIIAGAKESQVQFLITYNIKDYKINNIKSGLNIIVLTPAQFLQYLRSN